MSTESVPRHPARRGGIPRGISRTGPAILAYGFRPFFLAAGLFAIAVMVLWIGALTLGWPVGGAYGPLAWHGHEMLFGYAPAALAGFMLTAIPNWTGRLPVSGRPLLGLVAVWLAGRVAMLAPDGLPLWASAAADAAFLPLLGAVAAREIVAGRNWRNLPVIAAVTALAVANLAFHATVALAGDVGSVWRATTGLYLALVALIGGRIIPSFTRNWLARRGGGALPAPFGRFDRVAIAVLLVALASWTALPESPATALFAFTAAGLHAGRLARWRGWATLEEPLVLVLHVAYAFLPLGLGCVGLGALGWLGQPSALHVLTVGVIGGMTVAVMTRATRGHTGHPLTASPMTSVAYLALVLAAVIRPFAELLTAHYHLLLGTSGVLWIAAFSLFVIEHGPMLARRRGQPGQ